MQMSNVRNTVARTMAHRQIDGIREAAAMTRIAEPITPHPCHVRGMPQPHPYRFAGNQYLDGS